MGLKKDAFQGWDRAFDCRNAGGGVDGGLQKELFAGEFHGCLISFLKAYSVLRIFGDEEEYNIYFQYKRY